MSTPWNLSLQRILNSITIRVGSRKGGRLLWRVSEPNVRNGTRTNRNLPGRILIPGSLKVFPLQKDGVLYGALQHGIHRFESLNASGEYQRGDIARFTHLWILENGRVESTQRNEL